MAAPARVHSLGAATTAHPCAESPPGRSWFGETAFVLFALVQAADGVLTYLGVTAFGIKIEANPLIAWHMAMLGTGVALVGAKALAVLCAAALHLNARDGIISGLTAVYLVAAVGPWVQILWP